MVCDVWHAACVVHCMGVVCVWSVVFGIVCGVFVFGMACGVWHLVWHKVCGTWRGM